MLNVKECFDRMGSKEVQEHLLRYLFGFVAELGEGSAYVSMTDATQLVWGTSGRGNPNAKKKVEALHSLGFLDKVVKGRATYFRPRVGCVDLVKDHPDFAEEKASRARIDAIFPGCGIKPVWSL